MFKFLTFFLPIYFVIWQCVVAALAISHLFEKQPLYFPVVLIFTVLITWYTLHRLKSVSINTEYLLGLHTVRIPVELVLYWLYLEAKVPLVMTFMGWNFDIAIGITALIILIYQSVSGKKINQRLFQIWNITGLVFLSFIVLIAILSAPLPIQQFGQERPNVAVLEFPYCLLPSAVVPLVFMSHILLLRGIKRTSSR